MDDVSVLESIVGIWSKVDADTADGIIKNGMMYMRIFREGYFQYFECECKYNDGENTTAHYQWSKQVDKTPIVSYRNDTIGVEFLPFIWRRRYGVRLIRDTMADQRSVIFEGDTLCQLEKAIGLSEVKKRCPCYEEESDIR